jgi:ribosomal protein S13
MNKLFFLLLFLAPMICNAQYIDNLDIKNGFLQFKLGDSLAKYQPVLRSPDKLTPHKYQVKYKAIKLKKNLDELFLIEENGIVVGIQIYMVTDDQCQFINKAFEKAYGAPKEIKDEKENDLGRHHSFKIWRGKRVSAIAERTNTNARIGGINAELAFEKLEIKQISDVVIEGTLATDFEL